MRVGALTTDATEASHVRHQLARELAERCPRALAEEIAITGSVARGVADEASDIELNFWVEELPSPEERERWLCEMGATDLLPDEHPIADGSMWAWCRIRGIPIETGWQAIAAQDALIKETLAGNVLDHKRLIVADAILHGLALRTNGHLGRWQGALEHYPDAVQQTLITNAAALWRLPSFRWALARRGEHIILSQRLLADIHSVLRILFAINRTWEPEWKWLRATTGRLAIKPERLAERIDEIFTPPAAEQRVEACQRLIAETLALVPPEIDVSAARASIDRSLRDRAP